MHINDDSKQFAIIKGQMIGQIARKYGNPQEMKNASPPIIMNQTSSLDQSNSAIPSLKKCKNLRQSIRQMKVRSYTMIFIQKLKQNRLNVALPANCCEINIKYNAQSDRSSIKGFESRFKLKLIIDLITVLIIVFVQWFASFQMFFDDFRNEFQRYIWYVGIKYTMLCFISLRIICAFMLTVEIHGMKIQRMDQIILFYLKNADFCLDLSLFISLLLMILYPMNSFPGVIGYFASFANVITIGRVEQSIAVELFHNNNSSKKQYYNLLKLFFSNCVISHITATILIGITYIDPGQWNWMDKYGIAMEVWYIKYIYSAYWSSSIVFTVGFGDVSVANYHQALLLIFIVMTGCLILAYNITHVKRIILQLYLLEQNVQNQLATLRRVALSNNINHKLHQTMSQYIKYAAEIQRNFEVHQKRNLINMLPQQLKQDFLEQSSSNFFRGIPYFSFLSSKTKIKLSEKIILEIATPGEYLTHKRYSFQKIYFVRKGKIGLAYRKKGSKLNGTVLQIINVRLEMKLPELLNKYLLVRGRTLNYDIICQGYTTLSILTFDQLHDCLKEHPQDLEFFGQLKDSAKIGEEEWNRTPCKNCKGNHSIFVCPQLHYMPFRNFIFLKSQKNKLQNEQLHSPFQYKRQRPCLSKCYALSLWKSTFKKISKKKVPYSFKHNYYSIDVQFQREKLQFKSNYDYRSKHFEFEVDEIHNFENYFVHCNPKILVDTPLNRLKEFLMFQRENSSRSVW